MFRSMAAIRLAVLCIVACPAYGNAVGVDVSATLDDAGGNAYDLDVRYSPSEHLSLHAGAGRYSGTDETGDLHGTLLDAGVSMRNDRVGVSIDFYGFDDGADYETLTAAARAWIAAGDFQIALLGRRRDSSVGFTFQLSQREVHREAEFSAMGGGIEVSWLRENVAAYAMAVRYDFDDGFDRFMEFTNSPQPARRPRIEALVGSFLTQAQGAIDRQWGAGVEYQFGRHSVSLDLANVHDAILDAGSRSLAMTYHASVNARVDWSISAGMVDSETAGDIGFLGVSVGVTN